MNCSLVGSSQSLPQKYPDYFLRDRLHLIVFTERTHYSTRMKRAIPRSLSNVMIMKGTEFFSRFAGGSLKVSIYVLKQTQSHSQTAGHIFMQQQQHFSTSFACRNSTPLDSLLSFPNPSFQESFEDEMSWAGNSQQKQLGRRKERKSTRQSWHFPYPACYKLSQTWDSSPSLLTGPLWLSSIRDITSTNRGEL